MQRIRHRTQFDAVLSSPPLAKTPHFALHMADTSVHAEPHGLFPGGGLWLGVLIPKRWARHAVTRNTVRRQIYAVARECVAVLPQQGFVVRLRSGFSRSEFISATSEALKRAVRAELQQLFADRRVAQRLACDPVPAEVPHA